MKKPNMDEYIEIGAEFKRLRIELGKMAMKVSAASGKTKKHSRKIWKACAILDEARIELEDEMYLHYPFQATTHIFYGD